MRKVALLLTCMASLVLWGCSEKTSEWTSLFNGKDLDNWEKFLGPAFEGHEELAQTATPENVFSVVDLDGEKVIRISGVVFGTLATKESFENYHARIVMKWGKDVTRELNCGFLYYGHGPLGASFGTFLSSVECQLKHDQMGEVYMIGEDVLLDAKADTIGGRYYYQPEASEVTFGARANGRVIRIQDSAENEVGEWNTIEIYCVGQKSVHVVNGKVTMRTDNISCLKDGEVVPLTGGRLQLQSEGGELFVKSVEIRPVTEIPEL